jgi:hypothetical protein
MTSVDPQHPLAGCFARVDRAEAHLEFLRREIAILDAEAKLSVPIKVHIDRQRPSIEVSAAADVSLPHHIGIIFGDAVHNLHSALDNLVFALGKRDGRNPGRDSQFPIVNEPNEWFTDGVRRALDVVGPHDRARIEAHQPFMMRNNVAPKHNVLARLKRYSNVGKHQFVQPIGVVTSNASIGDNIATIDCRILGVEESIVKNLRKDAVIARLPIEITGASPSVRTVNLTIPWYAAIDTEPVEQFLALAHAYVHDLMVEFLDSFV